MQIQVAHIRTNVAGGGQADLQAIRFVTASYKMGQLLLHNVTSWTMEWCPSREPAQH